MYVRPCEVKLVLTNNAGETALLIGCIGKAVHVRGSPADAVRALQRCAVKVSCNENN